MNGRETSAAGALFFALASIGALIKGEELIGIGVGLVCAVIAATLLRQSVMQAAAAEEDNHQRLEIQFQQLRSKLNEGGTSNQSTLRTITEASEITQESLQGIRARLAGLESLPQIAESTEDIKSALKSIEESSKATQESIKKTADNSDAQTKLSKVSTEKLSTVEEKLSQLAEQSQKLNEITESTQSTTQTGLKLLQVVGQMLKTPPFSKDITQLCESMKTLTEKLEALEDLKKTTTNVSSDVFELTKINNIVAENSQSMVSSTDSLEMAIRSMSTDMLNLNGTFTENIKIVTDEIEKSVTNFSDILTKTQEDIAKLTTKIDAYNGLMKTAMEQYSSLTEQDVKVLEKIAEKIQ